MRAVVQRVSKAKVSTSGKTVGEIRKGLLVLLAVHADDTEDRIAKMGEKLLSLRIFEDAGGKMNLSIRDIRGELLIVSQFTLYGETAKGNRPSFTGSAPRVKAEDYYNRLIDYLRGSGFNTGTGAFGEMMQVELTNDGPVTIILDI